MPKENEDQPVGQNQTPELPVIERQPDILPDEVKLEEKPEDKITALQQQYEKEKADFQAKVKEAEEAKIALEKRLKDNQEYISRTRNLEKAQQTVDVPHKTFDEYLDDVAKKFEDDPKEAIKKIVRDVAFDRDLERQEYEKRIADAENRAFKRSVSLDPEKAKLLNAVENLEHERPDLANLTFEQKIEWIGRGKAVADNKREAMSDKVNRERDLAGDTGGTRTGQRGVKLPDWAHDSEVIEKGKNHFSSKKEMVDWSDPAKAREMAKRNRPQYANG
ncbi:MAG: hypothetical protein WC554_00970 [Clostridia bacterium]|jgi:hypothetical protein